LILGFRGLSYTIFDLHGKAKELFPTGKSPEPNITKLSDSSFVLGKDSQSFIMDTKGELVQHNPVKWSDTPNAIGSENEFIIYFLFFKFSLIKSIFNFAAWDDPYLLGIVHDRLEVYTLEGSEGSLHIQTIKDLNKARLIYRCKQGRVFVASMSQIWCIKAIDITLQIRTLLEQNQFQLALNLIVCCHLCEKINISHDLCFHVLINYAFACVRIWQI